MYRVLVANYEKCTGCRTCEVACSLKHLGECNPAISAVQIVKWEAEGLDVPMICQQCQEPACMGICPVRAISRSEATGAMIVDYDRCIGCRMCMIACPFGAVQFDADRKRVVKCDLCDGEPYCVRFCQAGALSFAWPTDTSFDRKRIAGRRLVETAERSTTLP